MCGIVAHWSRRVSISQAQLRVMTDRLAHRGPDDSGTWLSENGLAGLGHRRLSILDLSRDGRQPMSYQGGRTLITYNGEIYNFLKLKRELASLGLKLDTTSDTEVLLAAYLQWGPDCLARLDGMFAFVIYDSEKNQLFAARDRLGIKPLYYFWDGSTVVLASELKALLVHPAVSREVEPAAVRDFLVYGFVPEPRSIFKHIYKLPPGHSLLCQEEQLKTAVYWDLDFSQPRDMPENEWVEIISQSLDQAVGSHLVSDVPVGAFLSGGLDSSAVVSSMVSLGVEDPQIFSVGFQEAGFDERDKARLTCRSLGISLNELLVDRQGLGDHLELLTKIYDEPFGDASALPTTQLCEAASRKVKVILTGDGGDENFAGYRSYGHVAERAKTSKNSIVEQCELKTHKYLSPYDLRGPLWWNPMANRALLLVSRFLPFAGSFWERRNRRFMSPLEYGLRRRGHWLAEETERLLKPHDYDKAAYWAYQEAMQEGLHPVDQALRLGFKVFLPGRLLCKVDRASMAWGMETRVPFLDHQLVETIARVPHSLKMHNFEKKYLLKKVLGKRLPKEIIDQPKRGFTPPLTHWLTDQKLLQTLKKSIASNEFLAHIMQNSALLSFLDSFVGGKQYHRFWDLVILDRWSRYWLN